MAETIFWWVFLLSYGRRRNCGVWSFAAEGDIRQNNVLSNSE
jgi:hypothetical protein